MQLEAKN